MQKNMKLSVYIGRVSPPHNGHMHVIKTIAQDSDAILILIGSSHRSRSLKNPFTFQEREEILCDWINETPELFSSNLKIFIEPLEDNPYNDNQWMSQVQGKISDTIEDLQSDGGYVYSVDIVSSDKEDPKSYPHWFPNYGKRVLPAHQFNETVSSATAIRSCYFDEHWLYFKQEFSDNLPRATIDFLEKFHGTEPFKVLRQEFDFIKAYKKSWDTAPYPPIFVTTDAVVVQSGHVLLIQRRDNPGKGLWALPGGFLNPGERLKTGCIRELIEETMIKVPEKVLEGSIVRSEVFDSPSRSERGRTITHAFYFKLKDELELPDIKGSDDAEKAKWIPLADLHMMREKFYEDHFFILRNFI